MNTPLPEILENESNFICIRTGPVTVWFSYKTPVAFQVNGHGLVVRENDWSNTTGKHLNRIDGGNKKGRVDATTFQRLFELHNPKTP